MNSPSNPPSNMVQSIMKKKECSKYAAKYIASRILAVRQIKTATNLEDLKPALLWLAEHSMING